MRILLKHKEASPPSGWSGGYLARPLGSLPLGSCPGLGSPSVHGSATLRGPGTRKPPIRGRGLCPQPRSLPPREPRPLRLWFIRAVTSPLRGRPWKAAAATGYKLELPERSRRCSSVTSGGARDRSASGKYSLGGGCADPGPVGRTAGPPPQPRTHRLCSLLWTPGTTETPPGRRAPQPHPPPGCPQPGMEGSLPRRCDHTAGRWGLTVSQEWYQAAAQWSQILPRGPGLPPRMVGRVPRDGPRAWAGRPGTGVSLLPRLLTLQVQGRSGDTEAPLLGRMSRFGPPSSPSECPWLCPG